MEQNRLLVIANDSVTRVSIVDVIKPLLKAHKVFSEPFIPDKISPNSGVFIFCLTQEELVNSEVLFKKWLSEGIRAVVVTDASTLPNRLYLGLLQSGLFSLVHKAIGYASLRNAFFTEGLLQKVNSLLLFTPQGFEEFLKKRKALNNLSDRYLPYKLIVVGGSTGATEAVEQLVKQLPIGFPVPLVVVQHLPHEFTHRFAERLSQLTVNRVIVPQDHEPLLPASIYVLPSHQNMTIQALLSPDRLVIGETNQVFPEHNLPSIDAMLTSAVHYTGKHILAIILSGMGKDGAQGLGAIEKQGGMSVIQKPETSIAESMPMAAMAAATKSKLLTVGEIARLLQTTIGSLN